MSARLASGLWVQAYLARLRQAAIPAYLTARGDPSAGAVLVKCATLDGRAQLWHRSFDLATDSRHWIVQADDTETAIDALVARQRARDPDLWIIEIESRSGTSLLDDPGLAG